VPDPDVTDLCMARHPVCHTVLVCVLREGHEESTRPALHYDPIEGIEWRATGDG
jgi:hypothetical protein